MPTYGDDASPLTRSRQHQEDNEPRDQQAAGMLPSGDSSFGRNPSQVDVSRRSAGGAAVPDLSGEPQSLKLVTEST
jgi:hypothetical protein